MSNCVASREAEQELREEQQVSFSPVKPGGKKVYRALKRCIDFILALNAVVFLSLPLLLIGILIRLDSPGPAIFKQPRMGQNGKTFMIYKFRTMRMDAPPELATRRFRNSDEYITKLGAFLRRTSLDELPQLWNILRGEMSFVGYRPVCLSEEDLNDLRMEYGVFQIRPGLTGYAQIQGRDDLEYRRKAALDAEYVQRQSFKLDIWCLLKTVTVVFSGEGAK